MGQEGKIGRGGGKDPGVIGIEGKVDPGWGGVMRGVGKDFEEDLILSADDLELIIEGNHNDM